MCTFGTGTKLTLHRNLRSLTLLCIAWTLTACGGADREPAVSASPERLFAAARAGDVNGIRASLEHGRWVPREMYRAWRRGRSAHWIATLPFEELLPQPLDEVRAIVDIPPARDAHPDGIPRGNFTTS